MQIVYFNVDWWSVLKLLLFNWITIIGTIIFISCVIYFKYRWKIREWKIKKFNPKHTLTAIFLNKESCISFLPMKVINQEKFIFQNETSVVDEKAILHKREFKKTALDMSDEIFLIAKKYNILNPNSEITKELFRIANELKTCETYQIIEKTQFHTFHGKRWFWQKEDTGEPHSIYVDGVSMPLMKDFLLNRKGVKWNTEVINSLANNNFLIQLLSERNKINLKTIIIILIALVVAGIVIYYVNKPPVTP